LRIDAARADRGFPALGNSTSKLNPEAASSICVGPTLAVGSACSAILLLPTVLGFNAWYGLTLISRPNKSNFALRRREPNWHPAEHRCVSFA
jgi:hypothetical protein